MAGGDVEAPGRGGGGGGAGARVVAAHLAAAVLGLVAVVCSGTWCWGVLPEGANDAMYYLFYAAVMQFVYNVGWFFQEVKALFAGGSRRSFAPAEYEVELRLRVCIMYAAFGGGVVGACLASGFGGVFSIRNLGRYNWSAAALDAAVVCIFFAWAVNQIASFEESWIRSTQHTWSMDGRAPALRPSAPRRGRDGGPGQDLGAPRGRPAVHRPGVLG